MKMTLERHIQRIEKSAKVMERQINKIASECEKLGPNVKAVALEFVRPSDKALDTVCKVLEAYTAVYGLTADYVVDANQVLKTAVKAVKSSRDEAGYYTWKEYQKTVNQIDTKRAEKAAAKTVADEALEPHRSSGVN